MSCKGHWSPQQAGKPRGRALTPIRASGAKFKFFAVPTAGSYVLLLIDGPRPEESGLEPVSATSAEQLNRRWRPALMAFFLRRVKNPTDAEDLTQEVFVRMLDRTDGCPADAYIFQIAQNLLIDRSRKHLVRERYRDGVAVDPTRDLDGFDPHRLAEGREQLARIVGALGEMPERTRTIFVLYRVENMRQDVIASAFGISSSAVKQHVAKAMALLARKMRDDR